MPTTVRNGPNRGTAVRTPEWWENRRRALELVNSGMNQYEVASVMGVARSTISTWVRQANEALIEPAVIEYRNQHEAALRQMMVRCLEVINARHPVVSFGKAYFELEMSDGSRIPCEDAGPKLAAVARLQSLWDQLTKLRGGYPPVVHRIEQVPTDALEAELRALEVELARNDPDRPGTLALGPGHPDRPSAGGTPAQG